MTERKPLTPLTKVQTLEIMICETQNEITKCEVMEQLFARASLRGSSQRNDHAVGLNQAKIKQLSVSLEDLHDFHKEALAEEAKKKDN